MGIIIFILLICWLSDSDKGRTGSAATTAGRTQPHAYSHQAHLDRQRRERDAEQARIVVQRQQEYWARHQQEINQHNALVQQSRMTPGTSTASRTYWN